MEPAPAVPFLPVDLSSVLTLGSTRGGGRSPPASPRRLTLTTGPGDIHQTNASRSRTWLSPSVFLPEVPPVAQETTLARSLVRSTLPGFKIGYKQHLPAPSVRLGPGRARRRAWVEAYKDKRPGSQRLRWLPSLQGPRGTPGPQGQNYGYLVFRSSGGLT